MLPTLQSGTNFLETNFLNKLIMYGFEFIICLNNPHRVIEYQQRRNFRLNYKLILFSGCADIHNINTTVCVYISEHNEHHV